MKLYTKITFICSTCFLLLFIIYYHRDPTRYTNFINRKALYKKLVTKHNYRKEEFLIKTPRCSIPNYTKSYVTYTSKKNIKESCGERAVFIKAVSNDKIIFQIDKKKLRNYTKRKVTCCYKFGLNVLDRDSFTYTRCIPFQNGKKIKLLQEVVAVTCSTRINKMYTDIVYKDLYILVKKINKNIKPNKLKSWNILVLGMSSMSRGRMYNTMPRTVQYLQANKWLDYKGYHTVSDEMLPNVMSLLTGKKTTTVDANCMKISQKCNGMTIWHNFRNAGYITAFGDDYFQLPDGFPRNIFTPPSTDHHVWPYFHAKYKKRKGNIFCTEYAPSGKQLLDYVHHFVDTYKTTNFFGMFWINTFSSRIQTTPTLIDSDIVSFFQSINITGLLKNTFIMFLSDHGINFGDIKTHRELYYEKRLPMFFMWVPYEFQRLNSKEYNNAKINQNRIISPHDVHLTITDILKISNFTNITSETYPQYTSLFQEISLQRTCEDAGVDDVWCACHFLEDIDENNVRVSESIKLVVKHIQDKSKAIKTIPYMECVELHVKTVQRTQSYSKNNKMYYLIALVMSPGDFSYEARVLDDGKELNILSPITTITHHGRGNCAIDPYDRTFCLCNITVST